MKEVDKKKNQIVQDRICWLAGEENALGRFLKEHGKSDKTKAGKMMIGGCNFGTQHAVKAIWWHFRYEIVLAIW